MNYKEKCVELYERHLRDHFAATFDADENEKRVERMFNSEALSQIVGSNDHFMKVNAFVSVLVSEICRDVLDEKLEGVIKIIVGEVRQVIDGLLSEGDAIAVYEFALTEVGQKLLRNIDLLKESFFKGNVDITTEIVARWSRPEVAESIQAYISSLDSDDEE